MLNSKLLDAILNCEMNYEVYQNSFSPLYSNFGLGLDSAFAGIRTLFLHYNRATRSLYEPLLGFPGKVISYIPRADKVVYETEAGIFEMSFYEKDCVSVSCKTQSNVNIFVTETGTCGKLWTSHEADDTLILQGYSQNGDERDPDKEVAVSAGVRVIKGKLINENGKFYASPVDGEIVLAFAFDVMNVSADEIKSKLLRAPRNIEIASENIRLWIAETIKNLNIELKDDKASVVFVKALITLIFNLTVAPGNLDGFISSFPNRGGYPTHFMWDSCFQNLAYELMNEKIAEDSLLLLCENIRPDGKIPQFLCSTWFRPHDAQPALLGWAAKRFFEQTNDIEFIKRIFAPLENNNRWWLTNRITRFGVIKCADGLETGQDNSPRFDKGTVLAVDMNSYLLNQVKITAHFARLLSLEDKAAYWESVAEKLNDSMIKYLYDEEKNLFFDADAVTGEKQSLITSSGLIPLWAGVKIEESKIKAMINNYLLNPVYFYGNVPFPSVAYTEEVYDPKDWWRGPTWMPEAWLMTEILKKFGFEAEYRQSIEKLYNILLEDGVLHELFNSETGAGMGNVEQGWTAAVFIKLHMLLNGESA